MAEAEPPSGRRTPISEGLDDRDNDRFSGLGSPSRYRRDSRASEPDNLGLYGNSSLLKPPPSQPSEPFDKERAEKAEKKKTAIEQGKERGQITASAAMSVVSVAMLRIVLDDDKSDKYYKWRLGLICTALILQVLCGLLSLYVAFLRNYYSKFQDDFLRDCLKSCCSWRCRRTNRSGGERKKLGRSASDNTGCCPFECTSGEEGDFENEIFKQYDQTKEKLVMSDIETADFEYEIKWLVETVARLNADLHKYERTDVTDEAANHEYVNRIKEQLQQAQLKKEELEQKNRENKRLTVQANILEHHVEEITNEHVLKRATFWQNMLNIIFYVVFVLSAIIAGIGLSSPKVAEQT